MARQVKPKLRCGGEFPDLDKYLSHPPKKLVTYEEGARIYGLPYYSFVRLAKEAEANYPVRKTSIVDVEKVESFIDNHPDVEIRLIYTRERYCR